MYAIHNHAIEINYYIYREFNTLLKLYYSFKILIKMAPYKTSLQEDLRKHICQFRNSHLEKPKIFTVKHFLDEGASKAKKKRKRSKGEKNGQKAHRPIEKGI